MQVAPFCPQDMFLIVCKNPFRNQVTFHVQKYTQWLVVLWLWRHLCVVTVCILCESSVGCSIDSLSLQGNSISYIGTPAVLGPGKREDKKNETTHQKRIFTKICRGALSCVHVSTRLYNVQQERQKRLAVEIEKYKENFPIYQTSTTSPPS